MFGNFLTNKLTVNANRVGIRIFYHNTMHNQARSQLSLLISVTKTASLPSNSINFHNILDNWPIWSNHLQALLTLKHVWIVSSSFQKQKYKWKTKYWLYTFQIFHTKNVYCICAKLWSNMSDWWAVCGGYPYDHMSNNGILSAILAYACQTTLRLEGHRSWWQTPCIN